MAAGEALDPGLHSVMHGASKDQSDSTLSITLGQTLGAGTSGTVYDVLHGPSAASSSGPVRTLEISIRSEGAEGTRRHAAEALAEACSSGGRCVAKEVLLNDASDDEMARITKEVDLHRLVSRGCSDIVKYIFSGFAADSGSRQFIVVMEACQSDLWTVLTAPMDRASSTAFDRAPSNNSIGSSRNAKPGLQRSPSASHALTSHTVGRSKQPTVEERALWTQSLCTALHHCHRCGVLHRDLNPWNVLVAARADGERGRCARLADFGLAVELQPEAQLQGIEADGAQPLDESALDSLYSAPELGKCYGYAADVFSLGMTLMALWATADIGRGAAARSSDDLVTHVEAAKEGASRGEEAAASLVSHLQQAGSINAPPCELMLGMLHPKALVRPSAAFAASSCAAWYTKQAAPVIDEKEVVPQTKGPVEEIADAQAPPTSPPMRRRRCCGCSFTRTPVQKVG